MSITLHILLYNLLLKVQAVLILLISKAQYRLLSLLFSPGVTDVIRVTPSPIDDDSMVHKVGKSLICDPE